MSNPAALFDVSGRAPERRIHHRALVGASAWLQIGDERVPAECVDISMGGAAVRTSVELVNGTLVAFELEGSWDHGAILVDCEIVRTEPGELGLRFLTLSRRSLETIARLI